MGSTSELEYAALGGNISGSNVGPQGERGPIGPKGIRGPIGRQGIKGDKGDTGPRGEKGDQGLEGPQGIPGTDGTNGTNGSGITTIEKIDENGLLKTYRINYSGGYSDLVISDGPQGVQGPIGVQGAAGPQGPQGVKGDKGDTGSFTGTLSHTVLDDTSDADLHPISAITGLQTELTAISGDLINLRKLAKAAL